MSLFNSFDRSKHFSELGSPLVSGEGVLSPGTRLARARLNLGLVGVGGVPAAGREWYVDGNLGATVASGASGRSWDEAISTMSGVFTHADFGSGDIIYVKGNIREELTTPAGVFDVAIIGVGYKPRHADTHTGSGGYKGAATWRDPASGATAVPHLIVQQQGWLIHNIMFAMGGTNTAGVRLLANTGSGDDERDASHCVVSGCAFRGSGIGIEAHGLPNDIAIVDNEFISMTTGISSTVGAGAKTLRWARIHSNRFSDTTNGIVGGFNRATILDNLFLATMTKEVDLAGGSDNIVSRNVFMNNYDANVAGTTDLWYNNYSMDTTSAEVSDELAGSPSGFTYTIPVA